MQANIFQTLQNSVQVQQIVAWKVQTSPNCREAPELYIKNLSRKTSDLQKKVFMVLGYEFIVKNGLPL